MSSDKIVSAEIAKMQIADINSVLEILIESGLEAWGYNDFLSEILRRDALVLVSKIKTETIGFCIARLIITNCLTINLDSSKKNENLETECEIYNIAVRREFQNQGIGKQLLNKLVLLLKGYNTQSIWLEVRSSNRNALDFYHKNHFKQIYERKNFYSNPLENAIVMKRNLQTVSKQINSRA